MVFKRTSKYAYEMVVPKIAKNLKEKRDIADKQLKSRDEILSVLSPEGKINVKTSNPLSKFKEKIRKIVDKKAKGGRVGYRKGAPNPFARKSNVQKIAEVFGPKKKIKKEKQKQKQNIRMQAKKGGDAKKKKKFPDLTGDGKVTFADILKGRGVINGKKKTKKKII